jgi:hypothetical protein
MAKLISASLLAPFIPEDLKALCFYVRPCSGSTVRLCAVGDIGLSGRVRDTFNEKGSVLLEDFFSLFHSSDIVFGNLETTLIDPVLQDYLFASESQTLTILQNAGFNILHLANNHIYDYGVEGLRSTIEACNKYRITPLGINNDYQNISDIIITDYKDIRIGWLGCGRTLQKQTGDGPFYCEFDEIYLKAAINKARNDVDILIISIHIGFMYIDFPHPDHKAMAERLLIEGADLIIMHHAHVLQGVYIHENKGICYNLGNFLCDVGHGTVKSNVAVNEQHEGAVLLIEFDNQGLCLCSALPTYITEDRCVRWATGDRGLKILHRLKEISEQLETDYTSIFYEQQSERNLGVAFKVYLFHILRGNLSYVWEHFKRIRREHLHILFLFIFKFIKNINKSKK